MRRPPLRPIALAALALLGAAVAVLVQLGVRGSERLPLWDEAGNLWGAASLWSALAGGRLLEFLARLNEQDRWPFGFSLALLPFVGLGGGAREIALWLPAAAFAATAPLLVWAGAEVDRGARGPTGGALAGALWLAAPLPRALSTVVLRETAGAALAVALLAAWLAARRCGALAAWRRVALLLLALLLVKPNYALLSGAALALHATLDAGGARRRAALSRAWAAVFAAGWRSPARWGALVAAAAALSLLAGRNPGGLLYGALVVATVALIAVHGRALLAPGALLARLPVPVRALTEGFVAPVWIWCLSPAPVHPRNLIAFLINRESSFALGAVDATLYYPRVLAGQLAAAPALGWTLAGLAAAGLAGALPRPGPARALACSAGLGLALVALHPMKEPRFVVTVAPFVLLLGARTALAPLVRAARSGRRRRRLAATATGLVLGCAGWHAWGGAGAARLRSDHRLLTGEPSFRAALDDVVERCVRDGRTPGARVGLLGVSNQLSDALVRWEAWRTSGREAPLVDPLRGLDAGDPPAEIRARFARWLAREAPGRLVTVRPLARGGLAASDDYRRWNDWQRAALAALGTDPSWRPVRRRRHPRAGVEVATWLPRPARAP